MNQRKNPLDRNSMIRVMSVLIGVLVNVFMAYVVHVTGLPIYLDTIGTMAVAL